MLTSEGKKIAQAIADIPEIQKMAHPPEIETTKNHYAYYAALIQKIGEATGHAGQAGHFLAAEALTLAGGNAEGIGDAMFAFYGYAEYDPFMRMLAR